MNININRDIDIPIYVQIKNQIEDMINKGILREGYVLPPERKLAEMLSVNRSTVLRAYQELKSEGLIGSHVGKGTTVLSNKATVPVYSEKQVYPILWNQLFIRNTVSANERIIGEILELNSGSKVISFAGGMSTPDLYPEKEIAKIMIDIAMNHGKEFLSHSPVEGYYPLRESISKLLRRRDIHVSPREVIILSGSQQGLDLTSRIFLGPGDTVFVEEPTYLGAIQLFRMQGAKIVGIPMDSDGMRVDILKTMLERNRPKFIYTLPTFQNPSGRVMSHDRRIELLNLAYKYQIPILEDDPYSELRYEGDDIPSLKALDKHGYVIYLSTFSKTMFMGFRTGYIAAPPQVIEKFALYKQAVDLQTNTPSQIIFDRFIRDGYYLKHVDMVRKEYSKRRDEMYSSLMHYKVEGMEFEKPGGGYYIWLKLPQGVNQSKLISSASSRGVAFIPGEAFYPNGSSNGSYLRLNFTFCTSGTIEEGVKRLTLSIRDALSEGIDRTNKWTAYNTSPIV